jgi:hypothetical protein
LLISVITRDHRDGLKSQAQCELYLALALENRAVGVGKDAEAGGAISSAPGGTAGVAGWLAGGMDDVASGVDV